MLKKRFLLTALLSLAVMLTAASSVMMQQNELLREEFHQTYPLAESGRVSLENINGGVRVTAWDRNEVKVDAVKTAYRRDRLDEAKIVVRSDPNGIHIETTYPDRSQTFTNGEGRYENPATVEYTLMVPRNARIDSIELINGDLTVDAVAGDVKASSINGHVAGHELMGDVKLSTINGKVEAVFGHLNEAKSISLGSVNGAVSLVIPSDANAELKADTVHGGISNDFGLPVRRGEYVGRDLAGQLGQGGARIKLGNVNGGISIKHAPDGRPLSRATSLLGETVDDADADDDDDSDFDVDDVKSEARRTAREAEREAARARAEARRAELEAQRAELEAQRARHQALAETARAQAESRRTQAEGQRATREAQQQARSAQLTAEQIRLKAQLDAQREAQRAQAEGARAAREAQRIAERETARIRVETQRIAREAARVGTVEVESSNSLRLVERESKTFNVGGSPNINLNTFDGYITVHGWDKQEVQVSISKRAASEQQMRGIKVNTNQDGSNIQVGASFDHEFAQREPTISLPDAIVNLEVYVPRNSTVRLSTGDGRLELNGVNGNLDLNTGDGRIDVRDAKGRLTARTGDGRIEVENFDGNVEARTGDGRIILGGRFSALAARTGSGSILLSLPSDLNATIETDAEAVDNDGLTVTEEPGSSPRLKRWRIGQGGTVFSLKTGEGRVFLRNAQQ